MGRFASQRAWADDGLRISEVSTRSTASQSTVATLRWDASGHDLRRPELDGAYVAIDSDSCLASVVFAPDGIERIHTEGHICLAMTQDAVRAGPRFKSTEDIQQDFGSPTSALFRDRDWLMSASLSPSRSSCLSLKSGSPCPVIPANSCRDYGLPRAASSVIAADAVNVGAI
jgi:hypothetical protein